MKKELLSMFTTEQFASEIVIALTNKEIDDYLNFGCKLLIDAKTVLASGEYLELGLTKAQVKLDIVRIEYNLDQFTKAFLMKENMLVLTKYDEPMFFHMN